MKPIKHTRALHELGQSLWLDNITRGLLTSGTLDEYVRNLSVTGLTSNPSIFDLAIKHSHFYDKAIQEKKAAGKSGEALFFELAIEDLRQAADLFRPIYDATAGVDGWVSLEVSPSLAYDSDATIKAAAQLHLQAQRSNLFIKIPGTIEGLAAIEASIFAGVPVNVTLLFSAAQYVAAAEAYLRGIERRINVGLSTRIHSVASLFISRWDKALMGKAPVTLQDRLGIAVAKRVYKAYREFLASPRWCKAAAAGAPVQRLLWASTGTKDPKASDVLYINALAAPDTINTIPEKTLLAFADHGKITELMPINGGDSETVIEECAKAGIDVKKLADHLQSEGTTGFVKSWKDLLNCIESKNSTLAATI